MQIYIKSRGRQHNDGNNLKENKADTHAFLVAASLFSLVWEPLTSGKTFQIPWNRYIYTYTYTYYY